MYSSWQQLLNTFRCETFPERQASYMNNPDCSPAMGNMIIHILAFFVWFFQWKVYDKTVLMKTITKKKERCTQAMQMPASYAFLSNHGENHFRWLVLCITAINREHGSSLAHESNYLKTYSSQLPFQFTIYNMANLPDKVKLLYVHPSLAVSWKTSDGWIQTPKKKGIIMF